MIYYIKYYIITRNDIWPTHVFIANKLNIYTILINANFYKKTLCSSFINNFLYKSVLIRFNLILTGSKRLKDNLLNILQHNNILITGDSRIDRVIERKNNQKKLLPSSYKKSTTLILGSIVPSDCEYIFSALKEYLINGMETLKQNDQRIIIVPHEVNPKFLNGIISHLNKINLNYEYYSKQNISRESRIMIIDKVGILADLYYYSDLAYIGAGFNGGIHSVIEPAIHYNAISFGPNYKIVDMAVSLIRKKLASLIQNKTDILNFYNLMNDKAQLNNIKNNMKNFMNEQQSAAKIIVKEIFKNNNE